jgi:hypothetical protein
VCKEKDTFKQFRLEILKENITSTSRKNLGYYVPVYDMPHLFDQTSKDQTSKQTSNIRNFLGSCLKLLNDNTYLQVLQSFLKSAILEKK